MTGRLRRFSATYILEGDDKSPRAYLEATLELLSGRVAERRDEFEHEPTRLGAAHAQGMMHGYEDAHRLVESILRGLDQPVEKTHG